MTTNQDNLDFDINLGSGRDNNNTNIQQNPQNNISNNNNTTSAPQQNTNNQQVDFTNFLQHANHPGIVFFTLLFKVLAIVCFLLLHLFGISDALIFILVVILSAFDFWFVKNVSGRILVGLRWWNEVKEDGSEVWIFESDHEQRATSIDTTIFWGSLYICPIFWGIFSILEVISMQLMWFLVSVIAFILTFSNTIGYYKCSGEQKKKLTNFIAEKGQSGFAKLINYGANAVANSTNKQ